MTIRTEILINASKEKVWDVLTNFEGYSIWNPFIIESHGKPIEGSYLTNTMVSCDGTMTFKPKILKMEKYRYFDWMGKLIFKGLFDGHHYFEIVELGANQVKVVHGENFSGLLAGLILKKIGNDTRDNFIKMNLALKAEAESLV
ncbi:SRPBCC domain-containing protein [Litoribacter ruber]|uniref:SRPBCC domain-containing protein n=1 Tax=Litoribacter ruber TaxID=702568 RepID=UPI001BDABC45|nr:SRPBCC domain-containing protein [Litoribacter ruber]MBT0811206.1 SRPBCC domain-containing protein [Litoribacter ruber]